MKYLTLSLLLTACSFYPHDNFIEEAVEQEIYDHTGIEIDFTGRSKEKWV